MKRLQRRLFIVACYIFIDLVVIAAAFWVASRWTIKGTVGDVGIDRISRWWAFPAVSSLPPNLIFTLIMTMFLIYFLWTRHFYVTSRGTRYSQQFHGIARAVFLSALFTITVQVMFLRSEASRSFVCAQTIVVFFGLFTWRYLKRKFVEHLVSMGYRRTRSLIVGAGKLGRYLETALKSKEWLGVDVVGFLDDRFGLDEEISSGVLGRICDYEEIAGRHGIREVYITIPSERKIVPRLVEISNELGITVKVVPEMYDLIASEVFFENVGSLPVMKLCVPALRPGQIYLKRIFELALTVPLLIALMPLMALIALAIKIEDGGPVFFRQKVLGQGGNPMTIYKFRSMAPGADDSEHRKYLEKLVKTNAPADTGNGLYKLTNDDRITRVGRVIRKYSLDELPQLWNVIRGNLSLVGPRPPISYEYMHYDEYHRKRLLIKPGLTGLWQVSGKNRLSFEKMVMLDILYINDWSIWLDVKIILDTIPVLLRGDNL